jgi:hypothetical protein
VYAYETAFSGAIASHDVAETSRSLMSNDVKKMRIHARNMPATLVRRPEFDCLALDIAVGSGAVEPAKFLLEFGEAKPTRETLKMALSSGNFELVRICWERLPEIEQAERVDLLEVASDFHQPELLAWLFRDADRFAKELFIGIAIRRHLAGALLAVSVDGFKPWWAVEAARKWAPAREIEFGPAPEGFWPDGGWRTGSKGETKGIRAVRGEWTRELTMSELGKPGELRAVVMPSRVTAISATAFWDFRELTSVTLPADCRTIKDGTSAGRGAFSGCHSLVTPVIPKGCQWIGGSAFYNCTSMTNVTIPHGCKGVGVRAFCRCASLTDVRIRQGCTGIGQYAFAYCPSLTELAIPLGCRDIDEYAFTYCSSLTKVAIPQGCAGIGRSAFAFCSSLTEVVIPQSCTRIGQSAFEACAMLREVTIPQSCVSIGDSAFQGCWSLTTVTIPPGCTRIGLAAFSSCRTLAEVTIPGGCSIDGAAFAECARLVAVTILPGCKAISDFAFRKCTSLTTLTIPQGCTSIGRHAFGGCSSLATVMIPQGCSADQTAFDRCPKVKIMNG